jgi:hypothetical protein
VLDRLVAGVEVEDRVVVELTLPVGVVAAEDASGRRDHIGAQPEVAEDPDLAAGLETVLRNARDPVSGPNAHALRLGHARQRRRGFVGRLGVRIAGEVPKPLPLS